MSTLTEDFERLMALDRLVKALDRGDVAVVSSADDVVEEDATELVLDAVMFYRNSWGETMGLKPETLAKVFEEAPNEAK